MNALIAVAIALFVFFSGTGATVYAAQESQPNEFLYPVKTWSEDSLISLAESHQTRLEYVLDFSDRRLEEIAGLLADGEPIPAEVETRLQAQLDMALELAAGMEDAQMIPQLERIRLHAETQTQTMTTLMTGAPESAQTILARVQSMTQAQARLAAMGQADPQEFRTQVRQHEQTQAGLGTQTPAAGNGPQGTPAQGSDGTPGPSGNGNGFGSGGNESTEVPGQYDPGGNQPTGTQGQNGPDPQQTPVYTPQSGGGSENKP